MIFLGKIRFDVYLLREGYFDTREKAKVAIMSGSVTFKGQRADKPGMQVDELKVNKDDICIAPLSSKYVSRGGFKLEKAVSEFSLNLSGVVAMDVGASTGGFTDCMLQNGAAKVYAVDVGYGQFAWQLRNDTRVVLMERTNIRYIDKSAVEPLDFISVDVSFISLKTVLPSLLPLIHGGSEIVCLVKPQFEAGRHNVGKNGVVRDKSVHVSVLKDVISFALQSGLSLEGLSFSPIKGPKGNIEFLAFFRKCSRIIEFCGEYDEKISAVVEAAHCM